MEKWWIEVGIERGGRERMKGRSWGVKREGVEGWIEVGDRKTREWKGWRMEMGRGSEGWKEWWMERGG